MSGITPNLIHPVDVTIEQINRTDTVYDADAREPVQAACRCPAVTLPGQPRWGSSRRLEATAGGPVDNAQGYVLFRKLDLDSAGITLGINDRLQLQNRELYIVRLQPAGHYDGVPKLLRAYFADREPAKLDGTAEDYASPDQVEGLIGWYRSGIVVVESSRVARWPDQSGAGNDLFNTSVLQRPEYSTIRPSVNFDSGAALQQFLTTTKQMQQLFADRPFAVFAVCSATGVSGGIFGSQGTAPATLSLGTDSVIYGATLSFPQSAAFSLRVAWYDGADVVYRESREEKARAATALAAVLPQSCLLGLAQGLRLDGEIGELFFYSRSTPLALSEIEKLEAYAADAWGLDACG